MLRVHFTAEDLMRVRLVAQPVPLLELALALVQLQRGTADPVFANWRAGARATLHRAAVPLFDLVRPNGTGPLFLDPVSDGLDDGLDRVLSTSPAAVRAELVWLKTRPTVWLRGLAANDRESWQVLEAAMRGAYHTVLRRQWPRVQASVAADVAWRSQLLARRGVRETLSSLFRGARWRGTTLEISSPSERDLFPDGRGITLSPSPFWTGGPLLGADAAGGNLLVYPALTPLPLVEDPRGAEPLAALLGQTRAALLRLLVAPHTTTDIAHALAISASSASGQAKTLRSAGLVVSRRDGKAVWHSCTPLGLLLLAARTEPAGQP